jgi:hypothetical protein
MNLSFQKQALKVMLIVIALEACISFISFIVENEIQSQKEIIRRSIMGDAFLDCLETIHEREENIDIEKFENNSQLQSAQTKINIFNFSSLIVALGIIYLFSCGIVRVIMKNKFSKSLDSSAD